MDLTTEQLQKIVDIDSALTWAGAAMHVAEAFKAALDITGKEHPGVLPDVTNNQIQKIVRGLHIQHPIGQTHLLCLAAYACRTAAATEMSVRVDQQQARQAAEKTSWCAEEEALLQAAT